jgi:glycosyltransferase involved in cell wall biosynthesis
MKTPKVSIIAPIYNVEKYIEQFAKTLFEQTLDDIEYVFVNDCTPDNSVAILEKVIDDYPNRKPHVKIIHHQENRKLGSARHTGMQVATGDYFLNIDSDDYIEPEMCEIMYRQAKQDDADIAYCDIYRQFKEGGKEFVWSQNIALKDPIIDLMTLKLIPMIWNKLFKRSLFVNNDLVYAEGVHLYEDILITLQLFYFSKRTTYVSQPFYHYRKLDASMSNKKSEEYFEKLLFGTQKMIDFFEKQNLTEKYKKNIDIWKYTVKKEILFYSADRKKWYDLYPEARLHLFKPRVQDMFGNIACWATKHHFEWLVWLYFDGFKRFLSGIRNKIRN